MSLFKLSIIFFVALTGYCFSAENLTKEQALSHLSKLESSKKKLYKLFSEIASAEYFHSSVRFRKPWRHEIKNTLSSDENIYYIDDIGIKEPVSAENLATFKVFSKFRRKNNYDGYIIFNGIGKKKDIKNSKTTIIAAIYYDNDLIENLLKTAYEGKVPTKIKNKYVTHILYAGGAIKKALKSDGHNLSKQDTNEILRVGFKNDGRFVFSKPER